MHDTAAEKGDPAKGNKEALSPVVQTPVSTTSPSETTPSASHTNSESLVSASGSAETQGETGTSNVYDDDDDDDRSNLVENDDFEREIERALKEARTGPALCLEPPTCWLCDEHRMRFKSRLTWDLLGLEDSVISGSWARNKKTNEMVLRLSFLDAASRNPNSGGSSLQPADTVSSLKPDAFLALSSTHGRLVCNGVSLKLLATLLENVSRKVNMPSVTSFFSGVKAVPVTVTLQVNILFRKGRLPSFKVQRFRINVGEGVTFNMLRVTAPTTSEGKKQTEKSTSVEPSLPSSVPAPETPVEAPKEAPNSSTEEEEKEEEEEKKTGEGHNPEEEKAPEKTKGKAGDRNGTEKTNKKESVLWALQGRFTLHLQSLLDTIKSFEFGTAVSEGLNMVMNNGIFCIESSSSISLQVSIELGGPNQFTLKHFIVAVERIRLFGFPLSLKTAFVREAPSPSLSTPPPQNTVSGHSNQFILRLEKPRDSEEDTSLLAVVRELLMGKFTLPDQAENILRRFYLDDYSMFLYRQKPEMAAVKESSSAAPNSGATGAVKTTASPEPSPSPAATPKMSEKSSTPPTSVPELETTYSLALSMSASVRSDPAAKTAKTTCNAVVLRHRHRVCIVVEMTQGDISDVLGEYTEALGKSDGFNLELTRFELLLGSRPDLDQAQLEMECPFFHRHLHTPSTSNASNTSSSLPSPTATASKPSMKGETPTERSQDH